MNHLQPQRVPSYCDRILYKSLPGVRKNLKLGGFQCVESISTSDHKPVMASFQVACTPSISSTQDHMERTKVEIKDLMAKDLLGMDMMGQSDPYVRILLSFDHADLEFTLKCRSNFMVCQINYYNVIPMVVIQPLLPL